MKEKINFCSKVSMFIYLFIEEHETFQGFRQQYNSE